MRACAKGTRQIDLLAYKAGSALSRLFQGMKSVILGVTAEELSGGNAAAGRRGRMKVGPPQLTPRSHFRSISFSQNASDGELEGVDAQNRAIGEKTSTCCVSQRGF